MELRHAFFDALFDCCDSNCNAHLTLTAIHPDGTHHTPSRHVPVHDTVARRQALSRLDQVNALGWGAYFAVGLRRSGLGRWQRGGINEVIALPALFVDVDDVSSKTLTQLRNADPAPSCIVASGAGYHAYWWLDRPTTDLRRARQLLHSLAMRLGGDDLSVAQSLRVPYTHNTKPSRGNALCIVLELYKRRYAIEAFASYLPTTIADEIASNVVTRARTPFTPNTALIHQVADALMGCGYKRRGDWLNGTCPFPQRHKHNDQHPSFGFNTQTGYGFCHVCGTLLLKDLCAALNLSS
jgi:hypothetical protein